MLLDQIVLPGIVYPALVAGLLAIADPALLQGDRRRPSRTGALALAGGYLTAHVGLSGWPTLPPAETSEWLFWLVLGTAVLSTLLGLRDPDGRAVWIAWVPLVAVLLWTLTRPLVRYRWSVPQSAAWLVVIAISVLVLGWTLHRLARQAPAVVSPVVLLALFTTVAATLGLGASARLGQLAGALTASVAAGLVARAVLRRPIEVPGRLGAPVAALAIGGLVWSGYLYAELPAAGVAGACLAPAAALGALALRPLANARPWTRVVAATLAATVVTLPGAILAGQAARAAADEYEYGALQPEAAGYGRCPGQVPRAAA